MHLLFFFFPKFQEDIVCCRAKYEDNSIHSISHAIPPRKLNSILLKFIQLLVLDSNLNISKFKRKNCKIKDASKWLVSKELLFHEENVTFRL